jgi:uncharacterized membrane protein
MTELQLRTITKTVTWRIYTTCVGMLTAYLLTGNYRISGAIAISQLIINTIIYALHERAWLRILWGVQQDYENHIRTIVKTIGWRIIMLATATGIAYYWTGNLTTSGNFAVIQLVVNTSLNIIHERIWNRVPWGRSVA